MIDWVTSYGVARPFRLGSRSFAKGEVLRASDPDVARILDTGPDLLLVTGVRADSASPRPQEVAGVRSADARRPKRDWLADTPSWRLP